MHDRRQMPVRTGLRQRLASWRLARNHASRAPQGERIYAVGDIHGRHDLFQDLLDRIIQDHRRRGSAHSRLILLGDLVNRGASSRSVIDLAIKASGEFDSFAWLIGNHEEMFIEALNGNIDMLRMFLRSGGDETILSYGVDEGFLSLLSFEELSAMLPRFVSESHRHFLSTGQNMVECGDYVFVHAGIRPGVPLDRQDIRDLRWIRRDFVESKSFHGRVVVHGHTISSRPVNLAHRIGIDTGAFQSGRLTAVGLEDNRRWFL